MNNNETNIDPWLINLPDTKLLDSVSDTPRLGEKFSNIFLSNKYVDNFEIVKDMEATKYSQSLQIILKKPKNTTDVDRAIAKVIQYTKGFVTNNKELLLTRTDKGHITAVMGIQVN